MSALVVTPHPLSLQGQRYLDAQEAQLVPGEALAVFLERHGIVAGQQWVVSLGGVDVPERAWSRVKPKHGHLIEARRVPQNDVLKLVAVVALAYFTFGVGGMAGGSFLGLTGAAGYVAAGVAYMAGSMVINKLLGPKAPEASTRASNSSSPTYGLSGGRNQARLFEPMGLVLGEPYCVPDLSAQPYTFFFSGEQYLWQIFHAGINCAAVSDLRIGQTSVISYQGVTLHYEGMESGNTGLPRLSTNVDTIAGGMLDAPGGPGPWVVRTSSVDTIQLVVDLEGSLVQMADNGSYENALCEVQFEYRLVGATDWETLYDSSTYSVLVPPVYTTVGDGFLSSLVSPAYTQTISPTSLRLNNASTRPLRVSLQRSVPPGQYEVRAQKLTANSTASNAQNQISWSTLKSYQVDKGNYKGQSRVAMQIQASGQLNGSLDAVNWMARAKPMPFWNGSAWVTATNRSNGLSNPGALMLLLARGIYDDEGRLLAGMGWDDAQIDIENLKRFMVFCTTKGFTFDYYLQETLSIDELLNTIAGAGMGTVSWHPGKFSVIWFSDEEPIKGVLNMAAMKAKSFSVDYDTGATADEMEFQYFDRSRGNAWKSVRVLAPGVSTPTDTARQRLVGVTTEAHAATLARFYMAQNVYQRKTVNCDVDLEHLTFRRGTLMAVSHDVTQWGYGGRVKGAVNVDGVVTLTLDDLVPAIGPGGVATRYMGLRLPGESQYRIFPIAAFTGTSRTVTLASAWPDGVPVPGDASDNPAWDTVWIYDFKPTPGQTMRVASVQPEGDMVGARVALVPETPEFWTYVWTGAYTPPPNNSLLRGAPEVTNVLVTELLRRQGNTFYTELTMTFGIAGNYSRAELWGAVGDGELRLLDSTQGLALHWQGGLTETWSLELRTYSDLFAGVPYRMGYIVAGLSEPPGDVLNFSVAGDVLSWDQPGDVDLAGFVLRFQYGSNFNWGTAAPLHTGLITDSPFKLVNRPGGPVTVMIKAVDTSGNESRNANAVVIDLGDPPIANVVEVFDFEAMGFPGLLDGCTLSGDDLVANSTDSFYGADAQPFYGGDTDSFFPESSYAEMVYTTEEFSITAALAGSIGTLEIDYDGVDLKVEYRMAGPGPFYGSDADSFYGPDVDPFYGPPSVWLPWPGQLAMTANVYQLRVTIGAGAVQGVVRKLVLVVDAPDIVETIDDLLISAAGTPIPYTKAFTAIKNIQVTLQTNGSGAETVEVNKTNPLAPVAKAFNSAHVAVSGATVDINLKGY